MDTSTLTSRPDWPELRVRIGRTLELQASQQGFDTTTLATKMGFKTRLIRQVFEGRWRASGRYEHVARTLGSSLEYVLETLLSDPLEHPLTNTSTHPKRDTTREPSEHQNVTSNAHVRPPHDEHSTPLETTSPSIKTHADPPTSNASKHERDTPSYPLGLPPSNTSNHAFAHPLNHASAHTSKHASSYTPEHASPHASEHASAHAPEHASPHELEHASAPPSKPAHETSNDMTSTTHAFDAHRTRLAHALKQLIDASSDNQTQWGKRIGLSPSIVSAVLAARHKRRTHYDALAHALGYTITHDFELVPRLDPKPSPAPPVQPEQIQPLRPSPRLELDDPTRHLIEWSAAQRGLDPKLWLTLAVAAYHEAHSSQ